MGILLYLICTFCAWTYTLFRWSPVSPHIVRFFYGMMAPYQNYSLINVELIAEGQADDGIRKRIDLGPYFPESRGERAFRTFLIDFRVQGTENTRHAYRRLAEAIRAQEAARGRDCRTVELTFESWPVSPKGFSALRLPPFTAQIDPLALE